MIFFSFSFLNVDKTVHCQKAGHLNTRFCISLSYCNLKILKIHKHNLIVIHFEVKILTNFVKIANIEKLLNVQFV